MRFALDTNVLVYAYDIDVGDRHAVAVDLLERAVGQDCVLPLQALAELFRTLTAKRGVPPWRAADIVHAWRDAFPVVAAGEACLPDAMDAVADHGYSFWDAMIWAVAKHTGCRLLVSEDGQDGRTLGGVTTVNPFAADPSPLLRQALKSQTG